MNRASVVARPMSPSASRRPPAVRLLLLAFLVVSADMSPARAEFVNPHGVAVVIGNKGYRNERVPEVSYAHRDAEAFKRYVLDVLGFDPNRVFDLRDATQAELFTWFGNRESYEGRLWRYLHPRHGSDVVVYYSGHGVPGLKDRRGYLLPSDANPDTPEINGYPIDVLYANLGKPREAKSVRVFLDACFSGDSDRGMLIRSASPTFFKPDLPEVAGEKLTILTAASGTEVASWDEKSGHGMFTHHLLDALYGGGDADGDGRVTAAEAKAYLDDTMTIAARVEFGRHQNASLDGAAGAVLASAGTVGGAFPPRPGLDAPGPVVAGGSAGAGGGEETVGGEEEEVSAPPLEVAEAAESQLGLTRVQRVLVQEGLSSLGHDVGAADGVFGRRTRSGIESYQRGKGLAETGYLTVELSEALQALGKEARGVRLREEEAARAESERRKREADDAAFARAKRLHTAEGYREYLAGGGRHASEARALLKEVTKPEWAPGKKFRDCAGCPELVVVPSGTYEMGSPSSEEGREGDEGPVHEVTFARPFAVGVYEVTRGEFARFVSSTGRSMGNSCWVYEGGEWKERTGRHWQSPGFGQTDGHPVVCVSWEDAKGYVKWLSRETGKEYRLLSESEWEYVARGGRRTARYWGESEGGQCRYANGADREAKRHNSGWMTANCSDGHYRTAPVGSYEANGYKLHDVLGNVWEWVEDCWNSDYHGAPSDGRAWMSGDCSWHVLRGGSWYLEPRYLRSAYRSRSNSVFRYDFSGFRVARTLD